MRRVLFVAALFALLAACSLKSPEGARCDDIGGTAQCPEGQRCGADGTCSVAAVACAEICSATTCDGKTLNRCAPDALSICASTQPTTCGEHQDCSAATESCECPAGGCGAFRQCVPVGGETTCECKPDACTGVGTMCAPGGRATIACALDDGCYHALEPVGCLDPGEECGGGPLDARCACPSPGSLVGEGCGLVAGIASCDGGVLRTCQPKVAGSGCNVWKQVEDCALSGLECSAAGQGACLCPALPPSPRTIYADAAAARRDGLAVTGDQTPLCRFARLADALVVAAAGDTVKATGAPPVTFTESALTVPTGVGLATSDGTPTPANFIIEPDGTVAGAALVTLRPGATLSGFRVQNVGATGSGIAASCPNLADTAEVSIDTVEVQGKGTGATPLRFLHGIDLGGRCSVTLRNSLIEGASDSGVHVFSQSSAVVLTLTGNTVQRNLGATPYRINGVDRFAGGVALRGTTPTAMTFSGNKVLGNDGDQIVVAMTGTVSLQGGDCGAARNVIACYGSGVGISSAALSANVTNTSWPIPYLDLQPGTDYFLAPGSSLPGVTAGCDPYQAACPAPP